MFQTVVMSFCMMSMFYSVPDISKNMEPLIQQNIVVEAESSTDDIDIIEDAVNVPEEDIILLTLLTMAEAEGECEEGKRLVISTVLNRVDSEHFPDNIRDVIYQKNQFSSMWNGRFDRVTFDEDIYNLVIDELKNRTDYEVVFFTANQYGKYGTPMFRVENHYFSSYD